MLPELDYEWINSDEFKKRVENILAETEKAHKELEKSKQVTPLGLLEIWCD